MNNKFRGVYVVSACVAVLVSCSFSYKQRTDIIQTETLIIDSIASVMTIDEPTIMAYPDTMLSSVKKIDFRVDTFINGVSGDLVQLTDFYKDAPGILTFRGSPSRNMPFSGTVEGIPSKVSVKCFFTPILTQLAPTTVCGAEVRAGLDNLCSWSGTMIN